MTDLAAKPLPVSDGVIPMNFPALTTARLRLREMVAEDAADLFTLFSRPEVMEFYDELPYTNVQQAEQLITRFSNWHSKDTGRRWGLALPENNKIIGTCGLFAHNKIYRSCIVGYDLLPQYWGIGYMQDALKSVLNFGFNSMNINRIQATTNLDSARSIHTLKTLGFNEEGVLREWGFWKGKFHDVRCFSLLKSDSSPWRT
jgi:[ribosomal protein S5]-alanine N-acetyltransferase